MEYENIYLIRCYNNEEEFYKIGLTVNKFCRFYQIMKFGYNVDIVFMALKIDCYAAFDIEGELLERYRHYVPLIKFGGYTECVKPVNKKDFVAKLNHLLKYKPYNYIEDLKISWR